MEKSRRSLRIKEFLFYLSPTSSVLFRGMHWESWWSENHQNLSTNQSFQKKRTYPCFWPNSRNYCQACPVSGPDMSGPTPAPQRLSPSWTYPTQKLDYRNSNQTCLTPSPAISALSTLSWVKAQNQTCLVPQSGSGEVYRTCLGLWHPNGQIP
jgi:hypothetical protein